MNDFDRKVKDVLGSVIYACDIKIIQVNVGFRCNNSCRHCHLEAGPARSEMMSWDTMRSVVDVANQVEPELVDITGGSPELNPFLHRFVSILRAEGHEVQVRTNLTVTCEPRMEGMIQFYRDNRVRLVGSLPCYTKDNVDAQRGPGVFDRSIQALRRLNAVGYGSNPDLKLDLVHNPGGALLPGDQASLESDYRENLLRNYGIVFNSLRTITNMPIGRFEHFLQTTNEYERYNRLLRESFNPNTLDGLMCRHQVAIAWDGLLYDCDFNLAEYAPVGHGVSSRLCDFDMDRLSSRRIITGDYCFGCTAGHGSSCGGAIVPNGNEIPVAVRCKVPRSGKFI